MLMYYFYALLASIFWGVGFIGSKYGLDELGPIWLTFARFALAFCSFLPFLLKIKKSDFNRDLVKGSLICAVLLASMIILQISGLNYTTVAKSGFITILYAFFTPIICYYFYKQKISNSYWVLLGFSFFGMIMISEFNLSGLNYGDFLTLLCAIASAFHIIGVSKFTKNQSMLLFNLLQLGFVAGITLPLAILLEGSPQSLMSGTLFDNTKAISGIVFMGIFSTSLAFLLQIKSQQKIPAHIASLIFLLESPLAALLGYFAFQEVMSMTAIAGCSIVLISVGIMPFETASVRLIRGVKLNALRLARTMTLFVFVFGI